MTIACSDSNLKVSQKSYPMNGPVYINSDSTSVTGNRIYRRTGLPDTVDQPSTSIDYRTLEKHR